MNRLIQKKLHTASRARRTRSHIHGTAERPRLSVHVSNSHVTAQLIDDDKKATVVYATTVGSKATGTLTEKAMIVGKELSVKASKAKLTKVVFDRGAHAYHGRVKALADAARAGGLEF